MFARVIAHVPLPTCQGHATEQIRQCRRQADDIANDRRAVEYWRGVGIVSGHRSGIDPRAIQRRPDDDGEGEDMRDRQGVR